MHIIIAVITAIAGLIWALNSLQRAGFDLNSLNPGYWARRKRWENKQINPLYAIETPRELAAVLMFAAMRQAGDPTTQEKDHLLSLYETELKFAAPDATEMYSVASHLVATDPNYVHKVSDLVAPSLPAMSAEQKESIPQLVEKVASFNGDANATQQAFQRAIAQSLV